MNRALKAILAYDVSRSGTISNIVVGSKFNGYVILKAIEEIAISPAPVSPYTQFPNYEITLRLTSPFIAPHENIWNGELFHNVDSVNVFYNASGKHGIGEANCVSTDVFGIEQIAFAYAYNLTTPFALSPFKQ